MIGYWPDSAHGKTYDRGINMLNHLMIDLETMGTDPDTVILSIGAVPFNPYTKKVGTGISLYPSIQDQLDEGRTMTESTLRWWFKQSAEAANDWLKEQPVDNEKTKANFLSWYRLNFNGQGMKNIHPWGNGAGFDITIMESWLGDEVPWQFWNIRDTRTLWHAHPTDKIAPTVAHNALHDAEAQAHMVCNAWPIANGGG